MLSVMYKLVMCFSVSQVLKRTLFIVDFITIESEKSNQNIDYSDYGACLNISFNVILNFLRAYFSSKVQ